MLFVMNRTSFRCCMPAHLFVPLILRQWPGHSAIGKGFPSAERGFCQRKEGSASGRGLRQQKGVSASNQKAGHSASGKRVLPAAGASASEKFSFSFLEPSLRT